MNDAVPILSYRIEAGRAGRAPTWRIALLVTVLVILLAFVLCPVKIIGKGDGARATAARQDIAQFALALTAFKADTGRFPTTQEGLQSLVVQPGGLTTWNGPYVRSQTGFKDPWGNPYVYHRTVDRGAEGYQLLSLGPDGKEGTADDISAGDLSPP